MSATSALVGFGGGTCGLWGWFAVYRNMHKVHAVLLSRNPQRQDRTQTILILFVAALFVGITGLIALFMAQEEFNELARSTRN